jgi:Squalene-hopene cyclase C-terminal domain
MKRFSSSLALILLAAGPAIADDSPEGKALAYLAAEVPRWSPEHHCFSCHNNGDAARALYAAVRLGRSVPEKATLDTDRWLAKPEGWDKNGGDGPFSDKVLARLQFAAALASAIDAGRVADRAPLLRAAARLVDDQAEDGSWKVEDQDQVGSPATYGRPLATWVGRETLRLADASKYRPQTEKADAWLRRQPVERVFDASTVLLARAFDDSAEGLARRDKALDLLKRGQSGEGGWGPFVSSPTEAFDTALALLALDKHRDRPGVMSMIEKGRAYLIETQQADGSWTETTRPTGAESYAQRISTTGWATLALLTVKER